MAYCRWLGPLPNLIEGGDRETGRTRKVPSDYVEVGSLSSTATMETLPVDLATQDYAVLVRLKSSPALALNYGHQNSTRHAPASHANILLLICHALTSSRLLDITPIHAPLRFFLTPPLSLSISVSLLYAFSSSPPFLF